MSKAERIQAQLSFHKSAFFVSIGAIITTMAWIATNFQTAEPYILTGGILLILLGEFFAFIAYLKVTELFNDL